jgi:hypothetical protein
MGSMSRAQRARRYLQASLNASYTGLPAEHREAYEAQMRAHERAYPGVREHALAGADQDFDEPLTAGEREHQRHLRRQDGIEHAQVLAIRRGLRASTSGGAGGGRSRAGSSSGSRYARRAASGAGGALSTGAGVLGASGGGNVLMQLLGIGLLLSLAYLLLNEKGKGPAALAGLAGAVTTGARAFISPEDPLKRLQVALGANPTSSGSKTAAVGGSTAAAASTPGQPGEAAAVATTGKTAPPPSVAGSHIPGRLPPASLLRADLALRARSRKLVREHKITPAQAHTREETLIPRSQYPAFYSYGSS